VFRHFTGFGFCTRESVGKWSVVTQFKNLIIPGTATRARAPNVKVVAARLGTK
jgi:hypothetical protein